jgi:hypothetical protein
MCGQLELLRGDSGEQSARINRDMLMRRRFTATRAAGREKVATYESMMDPTKGLGGMFANAMKLSGSRRKCRSGRRSHSPTS